MSTVLLGAVAFLAMILVVVGVHEAGHFATAKWSGIRVDEFAIGFGPRLWQRRRGETVYAVRALPLGGFVKMPGMSSLEEDDGGERGFMHAPVWRRLVVLLAGVTMNFLLAGLLFGIHDMPGQPSTLPASGAAWQAGLRPGDVVTRVNGTAVSAAGVSSALRQADQASQGAPISVEYRRGDATRSAVIQPQLTIYDGDADQKVTSADGTRVIDFTVSSVDGHAVGTGDPAGVLGGGAPVTLEGTAYRGGDPAQPVHVTASLRGVRDGNGDGALGTVQAAWRIGYGAPVDGYSLPAGIVHGFASIPSQIGANVQNIYAVVTTPHSGGLQNFQGPVGIARDSAVAARSGWLDYLGFVGLVSLSLGIVNVLPVPPFDGGRVVLVLGEAVRRRSLAARVEMGFIVVGVALIGVLFVIITANDIKGF